MNPTQTKILILAARRALTALEPTSQAAIELDMALKQPPVTTVSKKVPRARYGPNPWRDGKCIDSDDAREFASAVHDRFLRGWKGLTAKQKRAGEKRFAAWRKANGDTRQALMHCACGGKASDHAEDGDGNLLTCSHCKTCDHFHYQTEGEAAVAA